MIIKWKNKEIDYWQYWQARGLLLTRRRQSLHRAGELTGLLLSLFLDRNYENLPKTKMISK